MKRQNMSSEMSIGGEGECVDADLVLGDLDRSGLCQRIDATLSRRVSITSRTAASSLTSA
jgi:hypothetical protein